MAPLGVDLTPYREQMNGLWNAGNNTKQLIVQHTTESEGGNDSVIGFLERTQNGSYQTMVDFDGEEVRMVPDDKQAWGAMNQGNRRGVHTCAMGRAEFSRNRWLQEGKLLERTALRYAEWSRLYSIPLVKISAADAAGGVRGIVGHIDISAAFHESDHWDPGHNFPYDVVIARANEIIIGTDKGDAVGALQEEFTNYKGKKIKLETAIFFMDQYVNEIREQLGGPVPFKGWPQLDSKTVVDSLASAHDKIDHLASALVQLQLAVAALAGAAVEKLPEAVQETTPTLGVTNG